MATNRIIITREDLAAKVRPPVPAADGPYNIPAPWRLASFALVLVPPLLFAASIVGLATTRRRPLQVRHAQAFHWCVLLLVASFLWAVVAIGVAAWMPFDSLPSVTLGSSLDIRDLPQTPAENGLSGREIAQRFSPLVVAIIPPQQLPTLTSDGEDIAACGAGALAFADRHGYLVLTSRHVIDALSLKPGIGQHVGVSLQDRQHALATVVGVHKTLDLALLWVGREQGKDGFIQSLRHFDSVEVGEQIFAIGHPEGLAFSISSGLVAQKRGLDLVQISAPVSPGNSGGPVYDSYGRLIGIVQSVIDKSRSPNAENLNFAVRVDDLFVADAWNLADTGRIAIEAIEEQQAEEPEIIKAPPASNETVPDTSRDDREGNDGNDQCDGV